MPSRSSACGFQSCVELQPAQCASKINEEKMAGSCGWSSLYSPLVIKNTIDVSLQQQPASIAVRGLRSIDLDLCTETLGCEAGEIYNSGDFFSSEESSYKSVCNVSKSCSKVSVKASLQFPPPLTTLRGDSRLRLHARRENSRLLLTPFKPSVLEAERSDGCLRLRLLPATAADIGINEVEEVEGEEEMGTGKYTRAVSRCKEEDVVVGCRRGKMMLRTDAAHWVATS